MFSHALSTHKCENEIDFFAAVDEGQSRDEAGAGMTGTLEFNSATYYRYAALNVGLLNEHLASLSYGQKRAVTDAFIRAALLSIPGARKNSMNGATLPSYVLGIVKTQGQPIQLVNAFETPVSSHNGIVAESVKALKDHHETLTKTWNITNEIAVAIPVVDLGTFCARLLDGAFPL
jgi:CRISPR system Cascade subunit CasC